VNAAATAAAADMPPDFRVSITDADGPDAYPISGFTWLLVPAHFADAQKGSAMKKFLTWMLEDGQTLAPPLLYAPLPPQVISLERAAISTVQTGPP
jgi:phosphate transport system substrate-binding protein